MTVKEQYWKYALITIIILLCVILFSEFRPFLSGILGACTVYVLVRKHMTYLTDKKRFKKSLAAALVLIETILCFLVPAFLVVWLIVNKVQNVHLDPTDLINSIQDFIHLVKEKTGYDIFSKENISGIAAYSTKIGQTIVGEISNFIINTIVMLFVLYFMLVSGREMEAYIHDILPFSDKNKNYVLKNVNVMVVSNAVGIPLLAVIQGAIATLGYIIFGAPNPVLFGFLTCFATIIPFIGTSLVWFPLAAYLALTGDWPNALGLAAYALLIISNVDNLIRFMLQKKMANIHPLITVFGVIIGLSLFGFWGVIFGPLLLSLFFLFVGIFKAEYLDGDEKKIIQDPNFKK